MSLTNEQWRDIQISSIQPYRFGESSHANKITRMVGLGESWILGRDSFTCTRSGNYTASCSQGHALKDDLYFNLFDAIELDIREPQNYVRNVGSNITIDREDIFYICLDLQYLETDPAPIGRIKIAKEKSELLTMKTIDDEGIRTRTVPRYLFLWAFSCVFDPTLNAYKIDQMHEKDPNDASIYRRILDMRGFTEFLEDIRSLSGIDDLKIIPTTPPSNKVRMNSGWYIRTDSKLPLYVSSMVSTEIDPVSSLGMYRFDLAIINDLKQLLIIKGAETTSSVFEGNVPFIPEKTYALGIIKVDEIANVVVEELDIIDAREFFNKGNSEIEELFDRKDDWQVGDEPIQTLKFIPDLNKKHNVFQDRLHGINYMHYRVINNLVQYDTVPENYSEVQAKPKARYGAMLCFLKANDFASTWDVPVNINKDLGFFIGADGLTMQEGVDYEVVITSEGFTVDWTTDPELLTYAMFYNEGQSDDGFDKQASKFTPDWSGNTGDVVWNMPFEPDWSKPHIMVLDSTDAEKDIDFTVNPINPAEVTFNTAPLRTFFLGYIIGESKPVIKKMFLKTDYESANDDTVIVPDPIDSAGILYAVCDKKFLEPFEDFWLEDEYTIKLAFDAEKYVKFIYYALI